MGPPDHHGLGTGSQTPKPAAKSYRIWCEALVAILAV